MTFMLKVSGEILVCRGVGRLIKIATCKEFEGSCLGGNSKINNREATLKTMLFSTELP